MFNPTMRLLPAFFWHVTSLLSLRHDGRGLPRLGSSMLVFLVGLKLVLSCFVVSVLIPEASILLGFVKSLLAVVLLFGVAISTRQSYAFSGYLLLWSSVDVGLLGLTLVVDRVPEEFITTCYAWGLLAFIVLLVRAAPHHEKENL